MQEEWTEPRDRSETGVVPGGGGSPASLDDRAASPPASAAGTSMENGWRLLPSYARSLLKISVPVSVTLAHTRRPLKQILELGPGSLIQFDKGCDESLSLEVNNQSVAVGEAVKVGEKFGIRITSMTMPHERFGPVNGRQGG